MGKGEGRKGAPPLPTPIRTSPWGGVRPPFEAFSPFPYGPLRTNTNSRNSPVLQKIPKSFETFLMSEYICPIYQSLCLDHFETPRHVRDHIWDSNLPSIHQSTKTHNTDRHRTLSVWTLRVRELCRHDRDMSPVNNQ